MRPDFAPKGIGELLDAALALLRRHWRGVFGAAGIVLFPVAFVLGTLQSFYLRGFLGMVPDLFTSPEQPPDSFFSLSATSSLVNAASSLYLLAGAFFAVALITALPALLYGREVRPVELLKGGWRRLVWYVLAAVALYVVLGAATGIVLVASIPTLGIAALVGVPALAWLAARLSLTPTVAVAEEANPLLALKRSWLLTAHGAWRVVGFFLGVTLLIQAIAAAINAPAVIRQIVDVLMNAQPDNPLLAITRPVAPGWKIMEGFLSAAAVTISAPVGHVAWYLFYLDFRSRREGMDLVARASALAEEGA